MQLSTYPNNTMKHTTKGRTLPICISSLLNLLIMFPSYFNLEYRCSSSWHLGRHPWYRIDICFTNPCCIILMYKANAFAYLYFLPFGLRFACWQGAVRAGLASCYTILCCKGAFWYGGYWWNRGYIKEATPAIRRNCQGLYRLYRSTFDILSCMQSV